MTKSHKDPTNDRGGHVASETQIGTMLMMSWRRLAIGCVAMLFFSSDLPGHEGHQPLPSKGVQVDLQAGQVTLSRAAREALDVQSVEVQVRDAQPSLRTYATVEAPWRQRAFVTSPLPGRIVRMNVRSGDVVAAGQVLAEVESVGLHALRLAYQKAENELKLSERILASLTPAVNVGSVPGQRLVEAENTHQQNINALAVVRAKAAGLGVPLSQISLETDHDAMPLRLRLNSPISGVVVHADVTVGKFVEPTEHLFDIIDTSRVWLKIGVLEQDIHRVQVGQAARVIFAGLPHSVFETTIDKLGVALDARTHQATAWAEMVNTAEDRRLLPGMHGQVELLLTGQRDALSVPLAAVFSDGAERYVFVETSATKESSEYRKKSVVIGYRMRDRAAIVAGDLVPGDYVVTRGGHELSSLFFQGSVRISRETATSIDLRLEPVAVQTVEPILQIDGVLEVPPQRRTFASSPWSGTLRDIHVDRGQSVKAGDVLAEIVSFDLQDVQLDLLRIHLDEIMWRNTRSRLRDASDAVARRSLLEAESRVELLESEYENVRRKLLSSGFSTEQIDQIVRTNQVIDTLPVRAPLDGIVVDFDRILGQVIRADEPLFEIHDVSQVRVQAFVGEREGSDVKIGQSARVRWVAFPNEEMVGKVVRLGPIVETTNRVQAVWIEFPQSSPSTLRHNMLARVTLTVGPAITTLAIPGSAVVRDGLRSFVFVRNADGTFVRRRIEVGRADDRFVEIHSGLVSGETIATKGVAQLQTAYAAVR